MAARGGARGAAGNRPVEVSSFVGRVDELLEIRRLFAVARTVTLVGAGGIGKSRLALRAAHQLGRHFPDGVWWVELGEMDSQDLVVDAIAQAVGANERPGVPLADAVVGFLGAHRLLLVLDNCEHLLSACRDVVAAIVSAGEHVRVLCTSRQRLGVAGESIVVVPPLGVPDPTKDATVAALSEADAIGLLVERARAVAPDFVLTEENSQAASEICRRLDGLPLAIELASVRLASLSPDDLLARIDDRFRLLWTEGRQQSRRHQALEATVEWSYELLGQEEQALWRRLSVFAGSFGLAAAEAVAAGDDLEQDRIVDLVGGLVDRSILTMRQGHRSSRYRFLETMRLYGAERLREAGEERDVQRRHASWYAELISGRDRGRWAFEGHVDFIDSVDKEWANIESALEFCAGSAIEAPLGLRMATDLWTYWAARGRYQRDFLHLKRLLQLAPTPNPVRALAVWALGWAALTIGDGLADDAFEEARRISQATGGDRELAYALMGLGAAHLRRAELTTSLELFTSALRAVGQGDDVTGRAMILYFIATTLSIDGRPSEALGFAREGLDLSEPGGDTMLHSLLGTLVGIVAWQLGDNAAAEAKLAEAARIRDRLDWVWGLVVSLDGLAWVAASSGRSERSARLLGAVASLWQQIGIPPVPYLQGHHTSCVASVRAELGEARYDACFEQGAALDRQELVALALDDKLPVADATTPVPPVEEVELTSRELEVARLVADGLSNRAIASTLFVSVATVKTHVSHILQKLALDSRVQLARWTAAHGVGPVASRDR